MCVVGTFLPWVRSGSVTRNGYASGGLLRRLLGVDEAAGVALSALPYLALSSAGCVVLLLVGYGSGRRGVATAGRIAAVVVVTLAGVGAVVGIASVPSYGVRLSAIGPATLLAGTALVWTSAIAFAITVHTAEEASRSTRLWRDRPGRTP